MLQNAYFLAKKKKKIGADTAENEQHFAENLPKFGNYPTAQVSEAGEVMKRRRAARRVGHDTSEVSFGHVPTRRGGGSLKTKDRPILFQQTVCTI